MSSTPTRTRPCSKCGSHITKPHCDRDKPCHWVKCTTCGATSDDNGNWMKA